MISITQCVSKADFEKARRISMDYITWLAMDLWFQDTDREFAEFNKMYGAPSGAYLIASDGAELAGGVGLRKWEDGICEMKRLYVYETHRGQGLGKRLCMELLDAARASGYVKMRLDTVARLKSANLLYESLGFHDIPRYCQNPDPTARFMEIEWPRGS